MCHRSVFCQCNQHGPDQCKDCEEQNQTLWKYVEDLGPGGQVLEGPDDEICTCNEEYEALSKVEICAECLKWHETLDAAERQLMEDLDAFIERRTQHFMDFAGVCIQTIEAQHAQNILTDLRRQCYIAEIMDKIRRKRESDAIALQQLRPHSGLGGRSGRFP
jgi:hypothetical protein